MFVYTNFNKFSQQNTILPFFFGKKMGQKNSEARFFSATYSQKRCAGKKKNNYFFAYNWVTKFVIEYK